MKRSVLLCAFLAACSSAPQRPPPSSPHAVPPPPVTQTPQPPARGGYYKDDGPGEAPPPNLAAIPDAAPRVEPLHRFANRPYQVFGKEYVPLSTRTPYRERGGASWYGKRFHGQRTSSGEVYDMYAMSAAHRTLPIPSYARVTNVANGRSVVVRINDRGPFHSNRIIDLSYAAAYRLGYIQAGSAQVEVEAILPGDKPLQVAAEKPSPQIEPQPAQSEAVYVQVGAFSSQANAELFRARMAAELGWLKESVQVMLHGELWRLQVGPYRTTDDARLVASRMESELNLKPLLVVR